MNTRANEKVGQTNLTAKIAVTVVCLALLVVHNRFPSILPDDKVAMALLIIAVLPWLAQFLEGAEVAGIKVAFRRLEKKADELASKVEATRRRIDHLMIFAMSPMTLYQLQKFAHPPWGEFYRMEALTRELTHLTNLGYLEFIPPCKGVDDIPFEEEHPNLSDFLRITEAGREFLSLREELGNSPTIAPHG